MNRELKRRFVEELRSGRRKQCFGALRKPTGEFCVTGVLMDLIDPAGWNEGDDFVHDYAIEGDGCATDLFNRLVIGDNKLADALMNDNDEGLTFEQIANIVELQVPEDDIPLEETKKILERDADRRRQEREDREREEYPNEEYPEEPNEQEEI